MTKPTLLHRLLSYAESQPKAPALHGRGPDGTPTHWTWADYATQVREVAAGLATLGVGPRDRVAILAGNRPEWVIAQYGIMAANAVPAPMYATLTVPQVKFILEHSGSKAVFCDSLEQAQKLRDAGGDSLHIISLVPFEMEGVTSLASLRASGESALDEIGQRIESVDPDALALLIYTSGTTGEPKGVMLRHRSMVVMADAVLARFPHLKPGIRYLSYLPLCHVAEQLMTNYLQLSSGGEVTFHDDPATLRDVLTDVRPQVFLGVPRVWEKMQASLESRLRESSGLRATLARWALRTELAAFKADVKRDDGQVRMGLRRQIARRVVIDRIRGAIGLDQVTVAVTGAAPISVSTLEFFASLGITIYEGYGMSETSGVATAARYQRPRFGTVGQPIDGVEVRIAEDGEILLRGEIMTRGYLDRPALTAELIDDDDWVHTGDLGALDDEGNLKITGRKKDIIITAGGKNIAPAELEGYIQSIEGIGQAMVVGDRKPYLAALITLDPEALGAVAEGAGVGGDSWTVDQLANDTKVAAWIQAQIEQHCNTNVARVQQVKRSQVLPVEFTVEGGELTPTMKLRRNVVTDRFGDVIESIYTS